MPRLNSLFSFDFVEKKHASPFVFCPSSSSSLGLKGDYTALARLGYEQNVMVYRCVNLVARSAAAVPLRLYNNGEQLAEHPLLTLLARPNPLQGGSAFLESVLSFLLLSGNAYIEAIGPDTEAPQELYALRPDRLRIVPGARGLPAAYEYKVQQKRRQIAVDPVSGHCPLLHIKFFHPANDWYGLSPLEAARQSIAFHGTVARHNMSLLENGGRPSGALCLKEGAHHLSEEQRQELRESLSDMYRGAGKAGQMMVLEGGFDWKEMGFSPKDMDFNQGKNMAAREIAQAFGVPPMLVGVPGDATFSNYKEARLHLWEDTILPLLNRLINHLNTWLVPVYSGSAGDLHVTYDADAIPPLAHKRESTWERLDRCTFLTTNEKREALGYPPLKEGDALAQPANEKKERNHVASAS